MFFCKCLLMFPFAGLRLLIAGLLDVLNGGLGINIFQPFIKKQNFFKNKILPFLFIHSLDRVRTWIRIRICIDLKCWIRIRTETHAERIPYTVKIYRQDSISLFSLNPLWSANLWRGPLTNVRTMYKIVHIYDYVLTVCILITKITVWSKPVLRVWEAGSGSESASKLSKARSRFPKAQNKAMEGLGRSQWKRECSKWSRGGSKWSRGGSVTPVVADSHHCDEEQDLDLDPHHSEKSDPDPH